MSAQDDFDRASPRPTAALMRGWVAPLSLGAAFVVLWPFAGFPWGPPALVCAVAVLARLLGLGARAPSDRRATVIGAALVTAMAWAISPWLVALAIGGLVAAVGLARIPRRIGVAGVGVAVAVAAGVGWAIDTTIAAGHIAADFAQTQAFNRAQLLPNDPRHVLGEVMALVADDDPSAACALFTPDAQQQLAAAFTTASCASAVHAWHTRVTEPAAYRLSPQLHGEQATLDTDGQTAILVACGLRWTSAITGPQPAPGPDSPGRMQLHRVLGQGFEIAHYAPCPPVE